MIDKGAPPKCSGWWSDSRMNFQLLGEPVDNLGHADTGITFPIHRSVPAFAQLLTKLSIFETRIKVVDLVSPLLLWKSCSRAAATCPLTPTPANGNMPPVQSQPNLNILSLSID